MKISKLIKELEKIKEEYGDLDCIYAIDDEGNDFHHVHNTPTPGNVRNLRERNLEFNQCWYDDNDNEMPIPKNKINTVCIN